MVILLFWYKVKTKTRHLKKMAWEFRHRTVNGSVHYNQWISGVCDCFFYNCIRVEGSHHLPKNPAVGKNTNFNLAFCKCKLEMLFWKSLSPPYQNCDSWAQNHECEILTLYFNNLRLQPFQRAFFSSLFQLFRRFSSMCLLLISGGSFFPLRELLFSGSYTVCHMCAIQMNKINVLNES